MRGNIDKGAWARKLPETEVLEVAGISIYVLHDLAQLDLKPEAAGFAVVVSGHSHVPKQETRDGVLYFNPGSAGPRRFKLPVSVGKLILEDGGVRGERICSADRPQPCNTDHRPLLQSHNECPLSFISRPAPAQPARAACSRPMARSKPPCLCL